MECKTKCFERPETLCWRCEKARGNGCSWFDGSYEPVDGWTAIKSLMWANKGEYKHHVETYLVLSCPEFDDDTYKYTQYHRHYKKGQSNG